MSSSVTIRFDTIERDITDAERAIGSFNNTLNLELWVSGLRYQMHLAVADVAEEGKVRIVPYNGDHDLTNSMQAEVYAFAINRDYANRGYTAQLNAPGPNIVATATLDEVTITAQIGTFSNGLSRHSLITTEYTYNNEVPSPEKTFTFEATGQGTCATEEYRATAATGGVAPYRLILKNNFIQQWDGVEDRIFTLQRAATYNGGLYDSENTLIKAVAINPTKNITASDFRVQTVPEIGHASITILNDAVKAGSYPLQYRLETPDGSAIDWRDANTFSGLGAGTYTLKVRDKYLCEVSKIISIEVLSSSLERGNTGYFTVSEYNSLSFFREEKHTVDKRGNYTNTPSYCERTNIAKAGTFFFPAGRNISTQFKSSFPFHRVTLVRRGHFSESLSFFEIQRNIGVDEKVDCAAFPLFRETVSFERGRGGRPSRTVITQIPIGTGVYFLGGVRYAPDSTTPLADPDSPYNKNLPGWAREGNSVKIDSLGTFTIDKTDLYDAERGVMYFQINANISSEQNLKAQSSWDRHPYNVFRFNTPSDLVPEEGAFVRIEPGIMQGTSFLADVTRIHRSEPIAKLADVSSYLKIKWSAFRNIGEMLFRDGIQCEMWVKGRMRPFSDSEAEFNDGDDRARSINQNAYLRMRGFFPLMSARHWRKLDLVGAIGNRGTVLIEDMELVRISPMEQEEQGSSNMSNITVDFAFATEGTANGQEDPVYSIDSGLIVSGAASTGRGEITGWEVSGNRLSTPEGEFIKVMVDGVETYVEIPE